MTTPASFPSHLSFSTRHTLASLANAGLSNTLVDNTGPLLPITDNPTFPPGSSSSSFFGASRLKPLRFHHVLTKGGLKPLDTLLQDRPSTRRAPFAYIQLRHFYSRHPHRLTLHRSLTPFEHLCLASSAPRHTISSIYGLLLSVRTISLPSFCRAWESELGKSFPPEQWARCFYLTHKAVIATKLQETSFKILARWYRVPAVLHRWYPSVPAS